MLFRINMSKSQNIIWLLMATLILSYCSAQKPMKENGMLKGTIGVFEGNCMPGPGQPPCKPKPIATTVFISKPSKSFQIENLVDSVVSREDGSFSILLREGTYSIFLRDGNNIVCTGLECPSECICSPVQILTNQELIKDLNIDRASW